VRGKLTETRRRLLLHHWTRKHERGQPGERCVRAWRTRLASTSSRSPAETHDGSTSMAERPQITRTDRACGHRGRNLWIKTRLRTTRHQHRKMSEPHG